MALYTDWELHSTQLSDLQNARTQLGFTQGDGFLNGVRYTINLYGQKYAPTGNMVTNRLGNQVPEMAPLPGYYAILRWYNGDNPFPPPGMNLPPRISVVGPGLPADSPVVFAS